MYDLIMLRRLSSWCKRTSLDHPSNLASYSKELQHSIALHWKISSEVKSMENTKPVAKVKPNKTDEEEESEDSIHLSTEDVSSSHSEYEPNWSESESESSLPPATILPSSQRDKKRKNDHECTPRQKKQKRSSRTSSREGDLKNTEDDSCGEQQSEGACPRQKKQKRSSKTSSREGDLKNTEDDSCGEQQSGMSE
ncbi:exostosin-1b-like isoform X3 [Astyanax mexicanus]|uniref:Exostosin-1b-like isoform X3 n=1 Tax=Astyanax mexicanus TaxID=7994 RepID=A0A8T2LRX1_ASTMX|nr:exostosin-1b-like isoform X3 [Astyanax mexicanus]